jgi:protein-L-isoaspartate O-methyltransferase
LRLYYNNRTTAKGFSVNQVTSSTVTDLDCGTGWTRAMLEDLELRIYSFEEEGLR